MNSSEVQISYFQSRMDLLGITPEINKVKIWRNEKKDNSNVDVLVDLPVFKEIPDKGIEILVYTLDRNTIRIEKEGSRMKKDFSIIRLEKPLTRNNGDVMKYQLPKGAGTHPFFPPRLVEKFEKKTPIDTLYLVEGYFKAFKAEMHGADIVGLSSITHMKGKDGKLHEEITKLMFACGVKKMVWLTDGDALDITQKEITDGLDLSKRPKGFFMSVSTFKNLLDDYEHIEKWFVHIDTDNILQTYKDPKLTRDQVKGIDDLLCSFAGKEDKIIKDLKSFSASEGFFQKFNVSYSMSKTWQHFHLRDVKEFYLFHVERRPELKNKEFIFNGTRYAYDEEKGDCMVKIPGDAKLYFRVGDNYYKFIKQPNQYDHLELVFMERKKSTIFDDHGKDFLKHVPKFEAFCNVPDHANFRQHIHNCFNVYSPLDYQPDEEECTAADCPGIMSFLYHLFGDKKAHYKDSESGEKKEYEMIEMALDYLELLYKHPQQKLPILCLVSRENNTGKSTFANFLRMMLGANVAIVGNADLVSDFNAHWSTKSVVICDETKIDKVHVVEKVKSLSTARKIFMNAKGRGQVELDCFIKFVLITNNENNFISLTNEDIRYWIIKVPQLKKENPDILEKFVEEMPSFLSFLNKRKMATEKKNRMWFHPELLKTEALRKVIAFSQSTMEKEIRHYMKELFLDTGVSEILMTQQAIHKEVFNNRHEKNYLGRVLTEDIKVEPYHKWTVEGITIDGVPKEYHTKEEALAAAEIKHPDVKGFMLEGKLQKKHKVCRHSYPKMEEVVTDGKREMKRVEITDNGRPLVFRREDFVKDEDNIVDVGAEARFINESVASIEGATARKSEELPF